MKWHKNMARFHEEDVEPLNLYFTDRSLLYEGWDDSDMYDFSSSLSKLSLQRWKKQNHTSVNLYYLFSLHHWGLALSASQRHTDPGESSPVPSLQVVILTANSFLLGVIVIYHMILFPWQHVHVLHMYLNGNNIVLQVLEKWWSENK
jgi:hypothetical protein